jgi:hypothetical protein
MRYTYKTALLVVVIEPSPIFITYPYVHRLNKINIIFSILMENNCIFFNEQFRRKNQYFHHNKLITANLINLCELLELFDPDIRFLMAFEINSDK